MTGLGSWASKGKTGAKKLKLSKRMGSWEKGISSEQMSLFELHNMVMCKFYQGAGK